MKQRARLPRGKGYAPWLKGKPILLVVDMQDKYPAARDPELVRRINAGVKRRMAAGHDVVFMSYWRQGDLTIERPYGVAQLWKSDDDGSESLLAYIAGRKTWPTRVEVWGVNTTCCVQKTSIGVGVMFDEAGYASVPVEVNLRYCGDRPSAVRFTRAA